MKYCLFIPFVLLVLSACHHPGSATAATATDTVSFPNIQLFLDDQFKKIDAQGTSLSLYETHNGAYDSSLIGVRDARQMVSPFIASSAEDNPANGQYTRSVFPDSVHHRTIISFEAEGDSAALNRVDVFLDSGTNDIRQLYLQCTQHFPDSSIRQQLIWKTDQEFSLIVTVDKSQYTADFRKQKVVWKRP
jgi:hypothetical protein